MSSVNTIAASDFDQANGPDVATVQADGMLNVLYNDGDGNLGNAYHNDSANALNVNVVYIEAVDLNGDAAPDVIAMDTRNSAFLVFLNNGDGTFAHASIVPVTPAGGAKLAGGGLTVADVNGDGKPDVLTVARLFSPSTTSTTLSQRTFLGNGDGTFQNPVGIDTTASGSFSLVVGSNLAVADMNLDGKRDLVLQLFGGSPSAIVIAFEAGNGDGTFQTIAASTAGVRAGSQAASSLRVSDVNGDGVPDAIFLTYSDRVFVAPGRPDGSFGTPSAVLSNMSAVAVLTLGDVNNDGEPDLIAFGSGQLGVFRGNGDGTFDPAPLGQYTGGYGIYQQPEPVDLDDDGNLDLVWLDYTNGRIALYYGSGDGTFSGASPIHPANPGNAEWAGNIQVIAAGDFNADHKPDVLAYDWPHASAGGAADLYVGLNDGKGKFFFKLAVPSGGLQVLAQRYGSFSIDAATADFNADGRADVILRTQVGLSVLWANADGTLDTNPVDVAFPVPIACGPFNYVSVGDANGDGFPDIVAGYAQNRFCGPSASTPSGYFVLLGDGAGHFDARFTSFGNALYFVRLADENGDGKEDLLVANLTSGSGFALDVVPGNGDGSFDTSRVSVPIANQFISNILVGDYNDDGKQDVALSTSGTVAPGGSVVPGTQGVLLMPGAGDFTFGAPTLILHGLSSIWNGTALSDLNGDGRPDLVFSTYAAAQKYMPDFGMVVAQNLGGGEFGPALSNVVPLSVTGRNLTVFVADFDGDKGPDVLLGSGTSSPLFLNPCGVKNKGIDDAEDSASGNGQRGIDTAKSMQCAHRSK